MLVAAIAVALAQLAAAQEPLHNGYSNRHGEYYYHDSGWGWWWFFMFIIIIIFFVACVYGGYSYGVATTSRQHAHGRYDVLDGSGKVVRSVRYDEDTTSSQYGGDGYPSLYRPLPPAMAPQQPAAEAATATTTTAAAAAAAESKLSKLKLHWV